MKSLSWPGYEPVGSRNYPTRPTDLSAETRIDGFFLPVAIEEVSFALAIRYREASWYGMNRSLVTSSELKVRLTGERYFQVAR